MPENSSYEKKLEHLKMIEGIIDRMGNNSFQLKGWAVALISVVGALSSRGTDRRFFLLTFIPLIAFWLLDAYYLQTERKYKVLYKNVCNRQDSEIDFNMDTAQIQCSGNETKRLRYCNCLFSKTEVLFYGIIAGAVLLLAVILKVF